MEEICYAPLSGSKRLSLQEVASLFTKAGLPCTIEPEGENMFWLVFNGSESNILASVESGAFVFGTFNYGPDDPVNVVEKVEEVMQSIGFSSEEGADYE